MQSIEITNKLLQMLFITVTVSWVIVNHNRV